MMNFLDPDILKRELLLARFDVEVSSSYKYPCEPEFARLHGMELEAALEVKKE